MCSTAQSHESTTSVKLRLSHRFDKLTFLDRKAVVYILAILVGSYLVRPSSLLGRLPQLRSTWTKRGQYSSSMSASTAANPYLNDNGKESVWKFPRPPDLQKTSRHLRVVYGDGDNEIVLADTKNAYRVLETR